MSDNQQERNVRGPSTPQTNRDFGPELRELLAQFVGFLSGDVPELHHVEVPRLAESIPRFLSAKGEPSAG
jgi:hypothetical protein